MQNLQQNNFYFSLHLDKEKLHEMNLHKSFILENEELVVETTLPTWSIFVRTYGVYSHVHNAESKLKATFTLYSTHEEPSVVHLYEDCFEIIYNSGWGKSLSDIFMYIHKLIYKQYDIMKLESKYLYLLVSSTSRNNVNMGCITMLCYSNKNGAMLSLLSAQSPPPPQHCVMCIATYVSSGIGPRELVPSSEMYASQHAKYAYTGQRHTT